MTAPKKGSTDRTDLRLAKAGDRAATGRVLDSHRGLLVQWCQARLRPGVEFDDLLQEAYLAGLDALRWFKPGRYRTARSATIGHHFANYLKVCVSNRLARFLTPRHPRPTLVQVDPGPPVEDAELVGRERLVDSPLTAAPSRDTPMPPEWLTSALDRLTPSELAIIRLRYGLGGGGELSPVMISKRLGVSRRLVNWLLHTAEEKLRGSRADDP